MPPTLKSAGMGHSGAKFGEEGANRCKLNSNAIWKRLKMHQTPTWQTDRPWNCNVDQSRRHRWHVA